MKKLMQKDGFRSVISSVLCIVAGLLVGFVVMILLALFNENLSIGDAFYGLTIACMILAKRGMFPPLLAATLPDLVFFGIGCHLFWRQR